TLALVSDYTDYFRLEVALAFPQNRMTAYRVLPGPKESSQPQADNNAPHRDILFIENSPMDQRNPHRPEIRRTHQSKPGPRRVAAGSVALVSRADPHHRAPSGDYWPGGHCSHRRNPRRGGRAGQKAVEQFLDLFSLVRTWGVHREQKPILRLEPTLDVQQPVEASNQEARAREQHQRETDFQCYQPRSQPALGVVSGLGPIAFPECADDVVVWRLECRCQ